jgi:hypothetical protein
MTDPERRLKFWLRLVPPDVVELQVTWERRQTVLRALVARCDNLDIERALWAESGWRCIMDAYRDNGRRSPVESYLVDGRCDVFCDTKEY